MIDIVREIEAVKREVGPGRIAAGEGRAVRLERTYDSPIEDVWDALTDPARIGRWFLPISGDYRVGGRYQFEGNAGGEIVSCERPNRLRVTWVYGEVTSPADISEVEVRLTSVGEGVDHARARAHRDRARGDVGPVRAGRGRCRLGRGPAGPHAPPARRHGRAIRSPGSCPTKAASSRPGAAWRGAPRTRLPARIRRLRRPPWRTPPSSTHRPPRRPDVVGFRHRV